MDTEKRQDWIVGCGGSDLNGVGFEILKNATVQEVKEFLVYSCVQSARDQDEDGCLGGSTYDSGTESVEEVYGEEELQAYADFNEYHLDWTAKPLSKVTTYEY